MRLTEMLKKSTPGNQKTDWDSLENVEFNSGDQSQNKTEELKDPNQLRQQRKLIGAILYNNIELMGNPDVNITDAQREYALESIRNQTITSDTFRLVIDKIAGPVDKSSPEKVFNNFNGQKHESRILATASGLGFYNYGRITPTDIKSFLTKYPNPADFEAFEKPFMDNIQANNNAEKYQEYQHAIRNFRHIIYGKKQEYYDSSKALIDEAMNNQNPSQELNQEASPEKILHKTKIDGDPFTYNDNKDYILTPEMLDRMNLGPRHEIHIDGAEIHLSENFKLDGRRDAVIGYVKNRDGEFKARSYYRSNSSGLWRYLPDYVNNNYERWYGKGYDEKSTILPFELQKKLDEICQTEPTNTNGYDPYFAFFGTAKKYSSKEIYADKLKSNSMRGDFYNEVQSRPLIRLSDHTERQIRPPEELDVYNDNAPDFSHQVSTTLRSNTAIYGIQDINLYESFNRKLKYLMCEIISHKTGETYAWVGGIEANSEITSTGCRKEWVQAGDICTPLYEYKSQSNGYGDVADTNGSYQSMWRNYLSRTPIIRRYLAQRHTQN